MAANLTPLISDDSRPVDRPYGWLHWGIIVAGMYLFLLVNITLPVVCAAFPSEAIKNGIPYTVYEEWQYWALIVPLVVSQFLLLRVPVRLATKRPVSRKSIWLPIVVSGFWFACLLLALGATLSELLRLEGDSFAKWVVGAAIFSWLVWAVVFAVMTRSRQPGEIVKKQSGWLLKGSILELLIAVPSHIVARGRTDCCAGFFTFVGITMGLSVMLLSFGPAVFFLYYARWKRLKAP